MSEPADHIRLLTGNLFRRTSGKIISVLTRIFGTQNLDTAEDVVQQTFIDAMQVWKLKGIPDNPSAWLFRVAKNKAIDIIRRNKHSIQYNFSDADRMLLNSEYTLAVTMESLWKEELIKDDLLRMMFVCCHPGISEENQITLILKTLCGFSTAEIAKSFLCPEDTISKRLYRTKQYFREENIKMIIPSVDELKIRTEAVLNSIYLLFNEGYNSTHSESLIRKELIDEALMLCKLLTENEHTRSAETYALMALMHFHAARTESRLTPEGEIILLPYQDRSKWDMKMISQGNEYMNMAAFGNSVSTYHLETAIAFEHCTAESFSKTNWKRILELYEWLCKMSPSPVLEMNKAVAVMQVKGAGAAMESIKALSGNKQMEKFYLYHSLMGEINSGLNNKEEAIRSFEKAIDLTQSETEHKILKEKIIPLL